MKEFNAAGKSNPPDEISEKLKKFPLVQVERIKDDGMAQVVACGHLLAEQSERLFLLNAQGGRMINFGDSVYSWRMISAAQCFQKISMSPAGASAPAKNALAGAAQ